MGAIHSLEPVQSRSDQRNLKSTGQGFGLGPLGITTRNVGEQQFAPAPFDFGLKDLCRLKFVAGNRGGSTRALLDRRGIVKSRERLHRPIGK